MWSRVSAVPQVTDRMSPLSVGVSNMSVPQPVPMERARPRPVPLSSSSFLLNADAQYKPRPPSLVGLSLQPSTSLARSELHASTTGARSNGAISRRFSCLSAASHPSTSPRASLSSQPQTKRTLSTSRSACLDIFKENQCECVAFSATFPSVSCFILTRWISEGRLRAAPSFFPAGRPLSCLLTAAVR
jgi:hypothetical protein